MFAGEFNGAKMLLAVAQRPFEHAKDSGIVNAFATLKPILFLDGRHDDLLIEDSLFPHNGDVWWMILPNRRTLAEPGRLLIGTLEESEHSQTPGKAYYQARADSVETVKPSQFVEILDVSADAITEPRQLVTREQLLELDHPPLDQVYARWRGTLYGPLRPRVVPADSGRWGVGLSTVNADHTAWQIPEAALERLPAGRRLRSHVEVSLNERTTYHFGGRPHACAYHLIHAEALKTILPAEATSVLLESDQALVLRAARKPFSRKKWQELKRALEEAAAVLDGTVPEAAAVTAALRARLEQQGQEVEHLVNALLSSGALDDRLDQALARAGQTYVEQHAARLQTEIEEKIVSIRAQLRESQKKREAVEEEIRALRRERLATLENELDQKQREFTHSCQEREERLEGQRRELDRQRDLLSKTLTKVSQDLAENRDAIVNQFLAISPLLQQLHLFAAPTSNGAAAPQAVAAPAAMESRPVETFTLPAYVTDGAAGQPVREADFFERFCKHVEESGFKHRRLDLAGFHLSVKCNDLTILGGLPGTGKSSLPRLYAEALAGAEYDDGLRRYLHLGVSPSWLDQRDVLGHVNALDRCFQPAETGLYPHLIHAQEEETRRGADARLYLVCVDEMNLAHVEHYFSAFLQALERPPAMREVRCFARELVSSDDPFYPWPVLYLPRSLRFVGTVNFDETTKQLSQRVLDRANLIRLRPPPLLDAREPNLTRCSGPAVTLRHYRDWVDPGAKLDRSLAELIDQLKDHLARLGCPLNPRRFAALRKFVGNAPSEICRPEEALDLQIAQRILPQVRGLFRPGAQEALDAVKKVLEDHPFGFPESRQWLEELRASDYTADLFAEGPGE